MESLKTTLSTNRILVDGQKVRLTAYNINGNNYVMLRDVGRAVDFNVYWDSDAKCVQVESKKPYTGEAPVTSAEAKPVEQPAQTDVAAAKQDIIDRTNALRRTKGVAALRVNDKLMQAAQVRADEMAASGVYSHTRPDGRKSNTVTDSKYTGENLHNISELYLEQQHKTLSEAVVELWSNSKAHADNMTSSRYSNIENVLHLQISEEQKSNADSVYNLARYGVAGGSEGWIPGADVPYIDADGFCSPIGSGWERRVTSEFGNRVDPITGQRRGHTGMDLAVPTGTPIRAALRGAVTVSKYNAGGYGYYVCIDHGNGLVTLYGHCSQLLARVGQNVQAGDIIALSGSTGRSTGPHLHFEVRVNGERTNPRAYLPKG